MFRFAFVILACGLLAGCGDSNPAVYPVTGTVSFNGEPLSTGTIVFIPKSGGASAQGQIGSGGKYTLTTFTDGDGALPGTHTVMVSAMKDNGPEAPATALVPDKFSSENSGLTGEVKEQDENVVDFDLKGRAPSGKAPVHMP